MKKFFKRFSRLAGFRRTEKIAGISVALLLIVIILVQVSLVYAGTLTNPLWDRLNRLKVDQSSGITHRLVFNTESTVTPNGRVYLIFPDADDTNWVRTAGTLTVATSTCASEESVTGLPGTLAASSTQGTGASSYDTFEIWQVGSLAAATTYCVDISANTAVLGTSASTGSKIITVKTNDGSSDVDTGKLAVSIITDEQVVVSALVEPSITFTLGANTRDLGTLSASAINTASSSVQTATNALYGFSTVVLENYNLRIDVSNDIDDANGDVDVSVEEYGMATTDSGQTILQDTEANCTTPGTAKIASAITSSWQTVAGATSGPVDETNSFCLAASITSSTTAGNYSHTLTFVSTAKY